MNLGPLSISLAVKDIRASLEFYRKLGFSEIDGQVEEKWLILQNGSAKIGLFQGTLAENVVTFYPSAVQEAQRRLREQGLDVESGAHYTLKDPDGNAILLDEY